MAPHGTTTNFPCFLFLKGKVAPMPTSYAQHRTLSGPGGDLFIFPRVVTSFYTHATTAVEGYLKVLNVVSLDC
jgi:hypothetical protein